MRKSPEKRRVKAIIGEREINPGIKMRVSPVTLKRNPPFNDLATMGLGTVE